jgi:hypothetical protein
MTAARRPPPQNRGKSPSHAESDRGLNNSRLTMPSRGSEVLLVPIPSSGGYALLEVAP